MNWKALARRREGFNFWSWNKFWDRGLCILSATWIWGECLKTKILKHLHDADLGTYFCPIISTSPKLYLNSYPMQFHGPISRNFINPEQFQWNPHKIYLVTQHVCKTLSSRTERPPLSTKTQETFQELNKSTSRTNSWVKFYIIGVRVNKPNTMKAYLPRKN